MLERTGVLRAITELVEDSRNGSGGALFVTGGAGLGKTAVLDHACKLMGPHARVGRGRGDAMETALPFGLITQVVEDVGGTSLLGEDAGDRSAFDVRASKFHRVLSWLRTVADGPVLLAVDDVHWADPDSLALLSFICRRISAMPVAVVATLRPWPPAAEELSLTLAQNGYASVEQLRPLSAAAAAELLAARLGRRPAGDLLAQALEASAGNPLLLELTALSMGGSAPPGRRRSDGGAGSQSVAQTLLLRRFAHLPGAAVSFARAASVLGRRFRPEVASDLAWLDDAETELALDALGRSGLLRSTDLGMAELTYPLLSQALYADLSSVVREQLHARAFRLLLERGMEEEASEHAVRGNLAGDTDAVATLTRAGAAALRCGAVATAVERLDRAVVLAGERTEPGLLLLLGEALMAEGRGDRAVDVYQRVIANPDPGPLAVAEARRMLGRALFLTGEVLHGARRLEEAAAQSGPAGAEATVQAQLDLSRAAWLRAGPAGALPAAVAAREASRAAGATAQVQADAAWGFVAFIGGDPAGLEATAAAGRRADPDDGSVLRDLAWHWGTLRNTGRAAKYAERFGQAESVFDTMFVQAEQSGSPHAIASLAAHHGDSLARQGRLAEARLLTDRALAFAELAPMAAAFAHAADALLLLHAGRLDDCEAACERAEEVATARGQWLPLLRVWHVRAIRHTYEGGLEAACDVFARLEVETARLGIGEPCLVPWARRGVIAFSGNGQLHLAERVQAWVEECARRLPCCWPRIAAESGRAALADVAGEHPAADRSYRAAVALHSEVDLPLEHVETLLQWGGYLRRTGRVVEGREVLRSALLVAERVGTVYLAAQAEGELTVAQGRRRQRDSPDRLTPQEQRVADLASAGRSSREIAKQLSLSIRTVETHLHRVYAKLGIHSQRELMTRARTTRQGSDTTSPDDGAENIT